MLPYFHKKVFPINSEWAATRLPFYVIAYFSTISSTSMGQALTQIPQAMHLDAGFSGFRTMTFMGQTATQAPQLTHFFLLIM
jgi:hypothetical protein